MTDLHLHVRCRTVGHWPAVTDGITSSPERAVPESQETEKLARIRMLIAAGELHHAAQEAADLCRCEPPSAEAFRLLALAECLTGRHAEAFDVLRRAATLPGGPSPALNRLVIFVEDQRRAEERADVYNDFIADSFKAMRWHSGRSRNLEVFARQDLAEEVLSPLAEAAGRLQRFALSPAGVKALSEQLVSAADAMMSAALAEAPPLLVLSDSHSRYFEWLVFEGLVPQRAAGVCSVSEANLYGLYMPSRDVPTRRRFREALEAFPSHSAIVLHLGEVDCRAVYWNLRQRLGRFDRSFLDAVTGNVERLLDEIAATHPRIVVTAPVRPSYLARPEDRMVDGELVLRLTNGLASKMQAICAARDLGFVSINRDLEEFGAGLGNRYFRMVSGKCEVTHHLSAPKVAGLWSRALVPLLR